MRENGHILVIGAAGLDMKGFAKHALIPSASNPGRIVNSFGGVGRNVAENLARLDVATRLLTVVGNDASGDLLMAQAAAAGVDMTHTLQLDDARTGTYMTILDEHGDLALAVSDFEIMLNITAELIQSNTRLIDEARFVVIDLNIHVDAIAMIVALCHQYDVPLCVDPTSPAHAGKIVDSLNKVFLVAPNHQETDVLCGVVSASPDAAMVAAKKLVAQGADIAIVTMGEQGVVYASAAQTSGHLNVPTLPVLDSTGAGDALTAGVIFGLVNDASLDDAMRLGISAAQVTLRSDETVHPELSPDFLYDNLLT